jgi:hypothetical protein
MKIIPSHPNYSIERTGEVYSHHSKRYIKDRVHPRGYRHVSLWSNGKESNCLTHRLVAETYLGTNPIKTVVNHKNFDKLDNRVENLEWCTQKENVRHASAHGRYGKGGGRKPTLTHFQAEEIRRRYKYEIISQTELAEEYGIGVALTNLIIHNKRYVKD